MGAAERKSKAEALARELLDAARCWREKAGERSDDPNRQRAAALERLAEHTRCLPDFDHRIAALSCIEPVDDGSPDVVPGLQDKPTTLQRIVVHGGFCERDTSDPDELLSALYEEYLSLGKRDAETYASLGEV